MKSPCSDWDRYPFGTFGDWDMYPSGASWLMYRLDMSVAYAVESGSYANSG
jgi:hypothetical protein